MVKVNTAFGWCLCKYGDRLSTRDPQNPLPSKDEATSPSSDNEDATTATQSTAASDP